MYYPPYYPGAALLSFGVGMAVGAAISGGWGWGCGWGGGNNTININNNNNFVNNSNRQNNVNRSGNSNWQHNAQQRGGVPYKDKATANKYGGGARGDSMSTRQSQARSREGGAGSASNRGGGSAASNRAGSGAASNRGGGAEQLQLGQLEPRRWPGRFAQQPLRKLQCVRRFSEREPRPREQFPGFLEHERLPRRRGVSGRRRRRRR